MMLPEWYEDKVKQGFGWKDDKDSSKAVREAEHLYANVNAIIEKKTDNNGCERFILTNSHREPDRNDVLRTIQAYLVMEGEEGSLDEQDGNVKANTNEFSDEDLEMLKEIKAKLTEKRNGGKKGNISEKKITDKSSNIKVAIHKLLEITKREGRVEETMIINNKSQFFGKPLLIEVSVKSLHAEALEVIKRVLDEYEDYPYPIFLYYPGMSDYTMKVLSWENGFICVYIVHPSSEYYQKCFVEELEDRGEIVDDSIDPAELVWKLMSFRGPDFTDKDVAIFVKNAVMKAKRNGHDRIEADDFEIPELNGRLGYKEMLDALYGQEEVKNKLQRLIALRRFGIARSKNGISFPLHTVFTGPPGVGKTSFAEAYSCGLAEEGITNGRFMKCCKADLVGKYVGHTADKITAMFSDEGAKGGVIFVDEADCLMTNDSFAGEAVKEFVRYMEMDSSTVVIFAIYESRAEDFYELDTGLKSRISNVLSFTSYTNDELFLIFRMMADREGFIINKEDEEECYELLSAYIDSIKDNDNFANAREVRIIMQHYIEQVAFASFINSSDPNDIEIIDINTLKCTISELKGERCSKTKPVMGFAVI